MFSVNMSKHKCKTEGREWGSAQTGNRCEGVEYTGEIPERLSILFLRAPAQNNDDN